jgi:lactose/L-arabinose transport system permease protein
MSLVRSRFSPARSALYVLLLFVSLVCVFPFYWMVLGTTLNPNDVVKGTLAPGDQFFNNWIKATVPYNLPQFFFNSLFIAIVTVVLGVTVNAMAAYGFEKFPSKAREWVFGILLLTLIMPQIAVILPLFRLVAAFGMLDSYWAIILPFTMSAFVIFFLRQNFQMFPKEIMEAARVDGAGESRIFVQITLPSMKAGIASAAILMFISQWNSYLWPLITSLSDHSKTLPLTMQSMINAYTVEYGGLMVIVTVSLLPVLVVFLAMQKHFVAGLVGSIK